LKVLDVNNSKNIVALFGFMYGLKSKRMYFLTGNVSFVLDIRIVRDEYSEVPA
jgi:hypothetical protein